MYNTSHFKNFTNTENVGNVRTVWILLDDWLTTSHRTCYPHSCAALPTPLEKQSQHNHVRSERSFKRFLSSSFVCPFLTQKAIRRSFVKLSSSSVRRSLTSRCGFANASPSHQTIEDSSLQPASTVPRFQCNNINVKVVRFLHF